MQAFLASVNDEMIDVITTGPIIPKKVNTAMGGPGGDQMIDKPKEQWDSSDRKRANLDAVSKNIFYQVLDNVMFNRIKGCQTAKEIWDKLIELCEGSVKIKKNKLEMVLAQFRTSRMKDGETVESYEIKLNGIINELVTLNHVLDKETINHKIIHSLSTAWAIKAEIMVGLKEHEKLSSADLWGELKAHEFSKMKEKLERGETTSHNLALTVEVGRDADLLALFTKRMEKLEKKVEKKPYSSDQPRLRYSDQY